MTRKLLKEVLFWMVVVFVLGMLPAVASWHVNKKYSMLMRCSGTVSKLSEYNANLQRYVKMAEAALRVGDEDYLRVITAEFNSTLAERDDILVQMFEIRWSSFDDERARTCENISFQVSISTEYLRAYLRSTATEAKRLSYMANIMAYLKSERKQFDELLWRIEGRGLPEIMDAQFDLA